MRDIVLVVAASDNGVIGALTFSLGSIKIRAVLDSLQLLPDSGC